jgi:hypothetical protein
VPLSARCTMLALLCCFAPRRRPPLPSIGLETILSRRPRIAVRGNPGICCVNLELV